MWSDDAAHTWYGDIATHFGSIAIVFVSSGAPIAEHSTTEWCGPPMPTPFISPPPAELGASTACTITACSPAAATWTRRLTCLTRRSSVFSAQKRTDQSARSGDVYAHATVPAKAPHL